MYTPRYDDEETVKLTMIGKRLEQKLPQVYELMKKEFYDGTPDKIAIDLEVMCPITFKEIESEIEPELLEWKARQEAENFNPYASDPEGEYLRREL